MRMVAACHRYAMFYHRSGMLLRCLHVLRYILDASPVRWATANPKTLEDP